MIDIKLEIKSFMSESYQQENTGSNYFKWTLSYHFPSNIFTLSFSKQITKHVKHLSTDVFKFYHLLENVNKNVELLDTVQKNTTKQLLFDFRKRFAARHLRFLHGFQY